MGLGSTSERGISFSLVQESRSALGPNQLHIRWVQGTVSPLVNWPVPEDGNAHPQNAQIKKKHPPPPMSSWLKAYTSEGTTFFGWYLLF